MIHYCEDFAAKKITDNGREFITTNLVNSV